MRILLLGASGQLGSALREVFGPAIVYAPSHADFDLASDDASDLLRDVSVDVVVNCAALHKLDACEARPDEAFAINATAVGRLAESCVKRGVAFATMSTDYVFDGNANRPYVEGDVPKPETVYGTSKLAGEFLARRAGERVFVFRTSGLFGQPASNKGLTLIERVLRRGTAGETTTVVDDVVFSPSYVPHVAAAMRDAIAAGAFGVHHVANGGFCSWFEFTRFALATAGIDPSFVEAIKYASVANGIRRPMFSALANGTFAAKGIAPLPTWQDAVRDYVSGRG